MKELDFDELDKAVSSLMTNTTALAPSSSDEPPEKTLNIVETDTSPKTSLFSSPQDEAVQKADEQPEEPSTTMPTPLKPAPAIRRSSGRFMDVVHPSSDMKQSPPISQSLRHGITVSPAPPLLDPVDNLNPDVTKPTSFGAAVDENDEPSNDWPDPLDMSHFEQDPSDAEPSTESTKPVEEEKSSLPSPFLADTKVEKRPLGGTNNLVVSEGLSDKVVNTPVPDAAEAQTVLDPAEFEAPLPEEYSQDLVAIESGEAQPQPVVEPDELPAPKPNIEKVPVATTNRPVEALIPDHFPDEDVPKGPSSIPQQYREQPSSGDQSNGSIYDTDAYHKPLAHPAKKKSGWLWVLWIVLILAVGAGIGAGLYYFGIVK